jgi:hypothetical protein
VLAGVDERAVTVNVSLADRRLLISPSLEPLVQ